MLQYPQYSIIKEEIKIMATDTAALRENFGNQLKNINEQIVKLEEDLVKAREYKTKLQGGLETLQILDPQEEEEAPSEETPVSETEIVE
jgi:hypothetical protein